MQNTLDGYTHIGWRSADISFFNGEDSKGNLFQLPLNSCSCSLDTKTKKNGVQLNLKKEKKKKRAKATL